MVSSSFRFSIDRGGTFTDVYAEVPGESGFRVVKLLSEDPQNYPDAPREGIRRILEAVTGETFPKESFNADKLSGFGWELLSPPMLFWNVKVRNDAGYD
jgi:5-oxoprolinase (ATP-hydrolysing)